MNDKHDSEERLEKKNMNSKIIDRSFFFKLSRILREEARSIDRNMRVEIKVMKTEDYLRLHEDV